MLLQGYLAGVLQAFALTTLAVSTQIGRDLLDGRSYGLKGLRCVLQILVPAVLPSILWGLEIGWAFAWRLAIVALIGLLVESLGLKTLVRLTVRRWGQRR